MFCLGTLINTGAVIAGGLLGITLKKGIPERCREVLMQACGVSTIFIGAGGIMSKMLTFTDGTLETQGTMLLIFSMIIGSLMGSLLDIEQRLEELGYQHTCDLYWCHGNRWFHRGWTDRKLFYADSESYS